MTARLETNLGKLRKKTIMKTLLKTVLVMVASVLAAVQPARATLIAAWDFNGIAAAPNTPATFTATVGSGLMDVSAFNPTTSGNERTKFAGTATVNAFAGGESTAGTALALLGGTSGAGGYDANGKSVIISASLSGYQGLVLSYATQGTSTGFTSQDWSYSNDGIIYTLFSSVTSITSSFTTETVDFSSITALNGDDSIFLKLTLSGATGASGNNRFDNFQLNAIAVPAAVPEVSTWFAGVGLSLGMIGTLVRNWRQHKSSEACQKQAGEF